MNTTTPPAGSAALYLRADGTLMLARADTTVELHLSVAQLLQLGIDALRVAVNLEPACIGDVGAALENTMVQVPVDSQEIPPCARLN